MRWSRRRSRRCRPRGRSCRGPGIGSSTGSNGTKNVPSGKSVPAAWASSIANRVLPIPPGPVIVSSRAVRSRLPRRRQLALAADERGDRGSAGCSAGRRSSGGPGSRSCRPSMTSWLSRSGSGKSRRRIRAELAPGHAARQGVADDAARRGRDHDLAAVAGGRDPGGPVDVDADVALADPGHLAGVQADPDPDRLRRPARSAAASPRWPVDRRPDRLRRRSGRSRRTSRPRCPARRRRGPANAVRRIARWLGQQRRIGARCRPPARAGSNPRCR